MVTRINVKKLIAVILIVAIILAGGGYSFIHLNKRYDVMGKLSQSFHHGDDTVTVYAIDSDTQVKLKDGTSMSFGDPSKPVVSVIGTTADIAKDSPLVGGKPSPLLNAVKEKKILLNLYLTDTNGGTNQGIQSLIRAASCNTYRDKTPGKIATLDRIVTHGTSITPDDTFETAIQKLGISDDVAAACINDDDRKEKITSSSINTETNTQFFMQALSITAPPFIIVDGQAANRLDVFNDQWVTNVTEKKPLLPSIVDTVTVKTVQE